MLRVWASVMAVAALGCLFAAGASAQPNGNERPNIILIVTDDQGYGDFGVTGNRVIETPHLDAMAARSAWLPTFYVSPVCSPTRASLMTGRYNYRTRVIDTYLGRSMMEPAEVTVAEVLHGAGYATGIFGKWHLGDTYPMRPNDQGFDESLVHRGGGLAQPADPPENERRYTDPILFRNGEQVQTEGYCTDVYFDAAATFIEKSRASGRPFFAYIPTNAPHGPYHDVPEDLRRRYAEKDLAWLVPGRDTLPDDSREADRLARIAAMITNIDENIGRLFARLDALGLTDNTLVLFLVDNGPNTRRYVGPFRGMKTEVYEGGVRSPLWAHWPARLDPGRVDDVPTAHIDVMPTILDACGVAPPDVKLDGRSFLPVLERRPVRFAERAIAIQAHRGDRPVRYHNFMLRRGDWKLLHASGFGRESFEGAPQFELYNLANDPGEQNDLAPQQPERVEELKAAYEAWFDDVSTTRPDNYAPPRIHIGTPHENPTVLTRQDWRNGTWERDSIGYWLVHVASEGPYDVRVRFDPRDEPGAVQLRMPGYSGKLDISPNATECTFRDVRLETRGEHAPEVRARIDHDGSSRGVYQIEITKR